MCDVDKKMVAEAAEMIAARQKSKKTPRTFGDWREMLKQEQFDIVHIATPDHWHALPMIAACKAGADVYVEKPVSVDVVEAQGHGSRPPASTTASCRSTCSGGARRT